MKENASVQHYSRKKEIRCKTKNKEKQNKTKQNNNKIDTNSNVANTTTGAMLTHR